MYLVLQLLIAIIGTVSAFSPIGGVVGSNSYKTSALLSKNTREYDKSIEHRQTDNDAKSRRIFLSTLQYPLLSSLYLPIANAASVPGKSEYAIFSLPLCDYLCKPYVLTFVAITPLSSVQQAVGSAESKCREEGNCLEIGELDGGK